MYICTYGQSSRLVKYVHTHGLQSSVLLPACMETRYRKYTYISYASRVVQCMHTPTRSINDQLGWVKVDWLIDRRAPKGTVYSLVAGHGGGPVSQPCTYMSMVKGSHDFVPL
jgi:hypothetical protein